MKEKKSLKENHISVKRGLGYKRQCVDYKDTTADINKFSLRLSEEIKPICHQAFEESLITGRKWRMTSPILERLGKEYAMNVASNKPETKSKFIKRMSKELNTTEQSISLSMSNAAFPAVMKKYMPIDSVVERHEALMSQEKDLKVAADMVKLAYKIHKVDTGDAKQPNSGGFAAFLQTINNNTTNNNGYGGEKQGVIDADDGTAEGSDVEDIEPLQNQE